MNIISLTGPTSPATSCCNTEQHVMRISEILHEVK